MDGSADLRILDRFGDVGRFGLRGTRTRAMSEETKTGRTVFREQGLMTCRNIQRAKGGRLGTSAILACAAWVMFQAVGVSAHEFWIEPTTFNPAPNQPVGLGLRVGERFKGEPVARDPLKIESFVVRGPHYFTKLVEGEPGAEPAGVVTLEHHGMHVVGYRNKRTHIELEAEKFEEYLRSEGLDRIIQIRKERGESDKPGREVYSRAAKTILNVGEPSAMAMEPNFRYTFEIVPLRNPATLRLGQDDFTVRCVQQGAVPVKKLAVFAERRDDPSEPMRAETDEDGRATFRFDRPGVWMVRAILMTPAAEGLNADWESIWATLVFEIPAPK